MDGFTDISVALDRMTEEVNRRFGSRSRAYRPEDTSGVDGHFRNGSSRELETPRTIRRRLMEEHNRNLDESGHELLEHFRQLMTESRREHTERIEELRRDFARDLMRARQSWESEAKSMGVVFVRRDYPERVTDYEGIVGPSLQEEEKILKQKLHNEMYERVNAQYREAEKRCIEEKEKFYMKEKAAMTESVKRKIEAERAPLEETVRKECVEKFDKNIHHLKDMIYKRLHQETEAELLEKMKDEMLEKKKRYTETQETMMKKRVDDYLAKKEAELMKEALKRSERSLESDDTLLKRLREEQERRLRVEVESGKAEAERRLREEMEEAIRTDLQDLLQRRRSEMEAEIHSSMEALKEEMKQERMVEIQRFLDDFVREQTDSMRQQAYLDIRQSITADREAMEREIRGQIENEIRSSIETEREAASSRIRREIEDDVRRSIVENEMDDIWRRVREEIYADLLAKERASILIQNQNNEGRVKKHRVSRDIGIGTDQCRAGETNRGDDTRNSTEAKRSVDNQAGVPINNSGETSSKTCDEVQKSAERDDLNVNLTGNGNTFNAPKFNAITTSNFNVNMSSAANDTQASEMRSQFLQELIEMKDKLYQESKRIMEDIFEGELRRLYVQNRDSDFYQNNTAERIRQDIQRLCNEVRQERIARSRAQQFAKMKRRNAANSTLIGQGVRAPMQARRASRPQSVPELNLRFAHESDSDYHAREQSSPPVISGAYDDIEEIDISYADPTPNPVSDTDSGDDTDEYKDHTTRPKTIYCSWTDTEREQSDHAEQPNENWEIPEPFEASAPRHEKSRSRSRKPRSKGQRRRDRRMRGTYEMEMPEGKQERHSRRSVSRRSRRLEVAMEKESAKENKDSLSAKPETEEQRVHKKPAKSIASNRQIESARGVLYHAYNDDKSAPTSPTKRDPDTQGRSSRKERCRKRKRRRPPSVEGKQTRSDDEITEQTVSTKQEVQAAKPEEKEDWPDSPISDVSPIPEAKKVSVVRKETIDAGDRGQQHELRSETKGVVQKNEPQATRSIESLGSWDSESEEESEGKPSPKGLKIQPHSSRDDRTDTVPTAKPSSATENAPAEKPLEKTDSLMSVNSWDLDSDEEESGVRAEPIQASVRGIITHKEEVQVEKGTIPAARSVPLNHAPPKADKAEEEMQIISASASLESANSWDSDSDVEDKETQKIDVEKKEVKDDQSKGSVDKEIDSILNVSFEESSQPRKTDRGEKGHIEKKEVRKSSSPEVQKAVDEMDKATEEPKYIDSFEKLELEILQMCSDDVKEPKVEKKDKTTSSASETKTADSGTSGFPGSAPERNTSEKHTAHADRRVKTGREKSAKSSKKIDESVNTMDYANNVGFKQGDEEGKSGRQIADPAGKPSKKKAADVRPTTSGVAEQDLPESVERTESSVAEQDLPESVERAESSQNLSDSNENSSQIVDEEVDTPEISMRDEYMSDVGECSLASPGSRKTRSQQSVHVNANDSKVNLVYSSTESESESEQSSQDTSSRKGTERKKKSPKNKKLCDKERELRKLEEKLAVEAEKRVKRNGEREDQLKQKREEAAKLHNGNGKGKQRKGLKGLVNTAKSKVNKFVRGNKKDVQRKKELLEKQKAEIAEQKKEEDKASDQRMKEIEQQIKERRLEIQREKQVEKRQEKQFQKDKKDIKKDSKDRKKKLQACRKTKQGTENTTDSDGETKTSRGTGRCTSDRRDETASSPKKGDHTERNRRKRKIQEDEKPVEKGKDSPKRRKETGSSGQCENEQADSPYDESQREGKPANVTGEEGDAQAPGPKTSEYDGVLFRLGNLQVDFTWTKKKDLEKKISKKEDELQKLVEKLSAERADRAKRQSEIEEEIAQKRIAVEEESGKEAKKKEAESSKPDSKKEKKTSEKQSDSTLEKLKSDEQLLKEQAKKQQKYSEQQVAELSMAIKQKKKELEDEKKLLKETEKKYRMEKKNLVKKAKEEALKKQEELKKEDAKQQTQVSNDTITEGEVHQKPIEGKSSGGDAQKKAAVSTGSEAGSEDVTRETEERGAHGGVIPSAHLSSVSHDEVIDEEHSDEEEDTLGDGRRIKKIKRNGLWDKIRDSIPKVHVTVNKPTIPFFSNKKTVSGQRDEDVEKEDEEKRRQKQREEYDKRLAKEDQKEYKREQKEMKEEEKREKVFDKQMKKQMEKEAKDYKKLEEIATKELKKEEKEKIKAEEKERKEQRKLDKGKDKEETKQDKIEQKEIQKEQVALLKDAKKEEKKKLEELVKIEKELAKKEREKKIAEIKQKKREEVVKRVQDKQEEKELVKSDKEIKKDEKRFEKDKKGFDKREQKYEKEKQKTLGEIQKLRNERIMKLKSMQARLGEVASEMKADTEQTDLPGPSSASANIYEDKDVGKTDEAEDDRQNKEEAMESSSDYDTEAEEGYRPTKPKSIADYRLLDIGIGGAEGGALEDDLFLEDVDASDTEFLGIYDPEFERKLRKKQRKDLKKRRQLEAERRERRELKIANLTGKKLPSVVAIDRKMMEDGIIPVPERIIPRTPRFDSQGRLIKLRNNFMEPEKETPTQETPQEEPTQGEQEVEPGPGPSVDPDEALWEAQGAKPKKSSIYERTKTFVMKHILRKGAVANGPFPTSLGVRSADDTGSANADDKPDFQEAPATGAPPAAASAPEAPSPDVELTEFMDFEYEDSEDEENRKRSDRPPVVIVSDSEDSTIILESFD